MSSFSVFEAVTVAPADGYLADTEDTLAIVPQSEKGWYIYTGPPAHWILPLKNGASVACGPPQTVLTLDLLSEVYGIPFEVLPHPNGYPWVMPSLNTS